MEEERSRNLKCNEVKVEVESADSYTVEVTAATFTRRRINGIHGYMRCVCNLHNTGSKLCDMKGMHGSVLTDTA